MPSGRFQDTALEVRVSPWQIDRVYVADPRRVLREHRQRWWQRLVGQCGCGERRPCAAVTAAEDVLYMRRGV